MPKTIREYLTQVAAVATLLVLVLSGRWIHGKIKDESALRAEVREYMDNITSVQRGQIEQTCQVWADAKQAEEEAKEGEPEEESPGR